MFVTEKAFGEVTEPALKLSWAIRQGKAFAPVRVKLSWAIREGAKLRPQCHGAMFRLGRSCALGAAYEALGGDPRVIDDYEVGEPVSNTFVSRLINEKCGPIDNAWLSTIIQMNDDGRYSREEIADHLEAHGL